MEIVYCVKLKTPCNNFLRFILNAIYSLSLIPSPKNTLRCDGFECVMLNISVLSFILMALS